MSKAATVPQNQVESNKTGEIRLQKRKKEEDAALETAAPHSNLTASADRGRCVPASVFPTRAANLFAGGLNGRQRRRIVA